MSRRRRVDLECLFCDVNKPGHAERDVVACAHTELVTLGDPWVISRGRPRNDTVLRGLGDQREERYEARCQAQVDQAALGP